MKRFFLFLCYFIITLTSQAQNGSYRSDVLWVTTPNHSNWLYSINEQATIDISVYEYGILQNNLKIAYSYGSELMPSNKSGIITLKNGKATLPIGTMSTPGFKDCQLKLKLNGQEYKHHIKVGFSPEKLRPYTMFPNDFVDFWQKNKQKAYECPVEISKTFIPKYSNDLVDCYLIKLQTFEKGNFVYGYLTIPKKEGKFPVVFSPPGAGIKPMDPLKHIFYAENGYIRFDMEIHGIRPDLDQKTYKEISKAFGSKNNSYLVNGLDNKDNYYMKKVYLSCVRAIDYLTSLKEWDGKNVIAQGGSQGGALALITTGLDKRITACAANHPALSDMAGYKANRAGGYPHLFTKFDGMNTPEKINTLSYYDVVNFAKLIDVPVFMTWGFNDNVCPPTTSYIVYNAIQSKKEKLITPINEHWVSTTTRYRILEWIKQQLK
ncbi:acetylxylan esterase [Wenyingzhuangia sp. IMCC45467]